MLREPKRDMKEKLEGLKAKLLKNLCQLVHKAPQCDTLRRGGLWSY